LRKTKLAGEWVKYVFRSRNAHGLHSPFVFDFYNICLKGKLPAAPISEYKKIKHELLNCNDPVEHLDLGAGSRVLKSENPRVKDIARTSLKNIKEAGMLARLAAFLNAKTIVELGTSFGTTSLLTARENPDAEIFTLEGSPGIASKAQEIFNKAGVKNIKLITGSFDDNFEKILKQTKQADLIIFDGNHRYEPTMRYFETALKYSHGKTALVFDDIRWSEEMLKAWKEIINHPQTTLTIDLFSMGIAFCDKGFSKQNLMIRW
jgi:predicted O-methyltransferase YrrM